MPSTKNVLRSILAAAALVALLGLAGYLLKAPILCSGLVNPYDKTAAFIVTVPENETADFEERITSFLESAGLGVSDGTIDTAEATAARAPLRIRQTIGCDGTTLVWSGNDVKQEEYLVTFHRNRLFNDQTPGLQDDFLSEFRTHYGVRPYVDRRS